MSEAPVFMREKIRRYDRRGLDRTEIAEKLDVPLQYVGTVLSRRNPDAVLRNQIARLCTIKDPEAYMQSKGVWYGDVMSMVRSA